MNKIYQIEGVLTDKEYNLKVDEMYSVAIKTNQWSVFNGFVMNHTCGKCKFDDELSKAIENSVNKQQIIYENESIIFNFDHNPTKNIIISDKRSFEAAHGYKNKKVAVLDFASSSHPGGSPWRSKAQEESLCRCSTLQECLIAAQPNYHDKHHGLGCWGTDDLIYIPDVVVFKSDSTVPKMLSKQERYKVDVIVSAAPHFYEGTSFDENKLKDVLTKRLEKVLQIAQKNGVEVLILGAYGCGAFNNPPEITSVVFRELLQKYYFETVEFAIYCSGDDKNNRIFRDKLIIDNPYMEDVELYAIGTSENIEPIVVFRYKGFLFDCVKEISNNNKKIHCHIELIPTVHLLGSLETHMPLVEFRFANKDDMITYKEYIDAANECVQKNKKILVESIRNKYLKRI